MLSSTFIYCYSLCWPLSQILNVDTGEILGPNQAGELCFHAPYTTRGYHKNPEATALLKDKDGWCHSGKPRKNARNTEQHGDA